MNREPNFEIVYRDSEVIRLRDCGPWDQFPTITNGVENVVAKLANEGILKPGMRLFYYDSEGEFTKILFSPKLEFVDFEYAGPDA